MEEISNALKSTTAKKQNLRKAFDSVKSTSLASFTLQWSDLEHHINSLQTSLEHRFKDLQSKQPSEQPSQVRSQLKSFCVKMDGFALRSFIMDHRKDLPASREDLVFALQFASDPAKLVLDGLQGFYPLKSKKNKGGELGAIRRTCVLLLEGLAVVSPVIDAKVKEEAKKLAVDWKIKVSTESDDQLEALVFLQLLGSYGLAEEFDVEEVLDLLASIARRKQAVDLFKGLGFQDNISDFVQKLSNKGKQVEAVKFVYAFDLVDKFPPVPLLEAHLKESKKVGQEVRKKGNYSSQSQNEAIAKETAYLRAIIKCIEDYKLETQYPRVNIDKRIEQLEKQKPEKKRPATAAAPSQVSKPQENQSQSGNKRPRLGVSNTASMQTVAPSSQIHLQPTGLFREYVSPHLSSSAHYGLAGPVGSTFPQYMRATARPSDAGAAPTNFGSNSSSSLSQLYPSEAHLPSSLYDRSTSFGGYGSLRSYGSSSFYS